MIAMEENLHGHFAILQRHVQGMLVEDTEDLLLVDSGLPSDTFNQIARARLTPVDADRRIAEALEHFRSVGRPFSWWVGPGSRPLDLERRLEDHGLRAVGTELGMALEWTALPTRPPLPTGLAVQRVRTAGDLADWVAVIGSCDDPPDPAVAAFYARAATVLLAEECPTRLYLGRVHEEAVATSEVFLVGSVAGVYGMATHPAFRRRGIGTAMTWAALEEARRLGVGTVILQATEVGEGVYARLGFRTCCRFVEYQ
jgi:GNAT superfamily N-acetyltransferase